MPLKIAMLTINFPRPRMGRLICLAGALVLAPSAVWAAMATQCEHDRGLLAKNWKKTTAETLLFVCRGHYVSDMKILLTQTDRGDFNLTVALEGKVYRGTIFGKPVERLRAQSGNYVLNSEKSCFIRGNLSKPAILHFGERELPGDLTYFSADNSLDYIDCDSPK
jgi:hypothetical protein